MSVREIIASDLYKSLHKTQTKDKQENCALKTN